MLTPLGEPRLGEERAYQAARALVSRHDRFVLTTHRDPDGDGIGAEVALSEALGQLGKAVSVINDGVVPARYHFLPGTDAIERFQAPLHRAMLAKMPVVVLLDAARPERTGRLAPMLAGYEGPTMAIDHHLERGWAKVELVDPRACSTTELVHELLGHLSVRPTSTIAEALYTGLVTDTQGFRTSHTTPAAHRRAAQFMEAGAAHARVHEALFGSWPLGQLRLRGQFLASLRSIDGGAIVWGVVDRAMLRHHRQTAEALEGFVEEALTVAGAKMAVFFLEEAKTVRVSLRSRGEVTVGALARQFGGGGHAQAAGARIEGPLRAIVPRVLREARRIVRTGGA